MNFNKHIWEGWTVQDFITDLEVIFDLKFNDVGPYPWQQKPTKQEIKEWCMDNQPYYKKYIPEVVNYFWDKIQQKLA